MREVKYTTRFKRDYQREKSGRHGKKLDTLLMEVVNLLAADKLLPRRNFDHPLAGEWSDHRVPIPIMKRSPLRRRAALPNLARPPGQQYFSPRLRRTS